MINTALDKMSEELLSISGLPSKIWRFPQCAFTMECSDAVLEQVRGDVEQAYRSRRGKLETGGVLFGIHEADRILILAAKPLACQHAMGPGFVLSDDDENRLAQLIVAPETNPDLKGLLALGWYHSHIRSQIFLSARDRQLHARYFNSPFQIALVIHPGSERPTRAGFFFREPSGEMRTDGSYEEFTIEPPSPAISPSQEAVAPRHQQTRRHRSFPAKTSEPARELICPKCASKQVRLSRRMGLPERFCAVFGLHPYRCTECLSRSFLKTSASVLSSVPARRRKGPEARRRAWQHTRQDLLLWGGGIIGFLAILHYLVRDTSSSDAP